MFAGHLGAGLALKGHCKGVSLGALFIATLLLDALLWVLVLAGVESVHAPAANYRTAADLTFDFPYSHGLVASLGWSLGSAAVCWVLWRNRAARRRAGFVIAAAVFSHFILDWLVHIPELPLLGNGSPKLGLGLWRHLAVAWFVELLVVIAGVWLYLGAMRLTRARKVALIAVMGVVMAMTVVGQAHEAPPPTPGQLAVASLVTIAVLVALGFWIDRGANGEETVKPG